MISSDGIRGYNDAIILSILSNEDSYGYEISKRIREGTDALYVIKETTLYSAFTRLENKIDPLISWRSDAWQKRTYYQITADGRASLTEKILEWQQTKIVVDQFLQGGDK